MNAWFFWALAGTPLFLCQSLVTSSFWPPHKISLINIFHALYKPTPFPTASGRAVIFFLDKHRKTFVERSCYWKHLAVLQREITIRWGFHLQLSPRITQTARLTNRWFLCSTIIAYSPHLNPEIQLKQKIKASICLFINNMIRQYSYQKKRYISVNLWSI